jgi:HPt (histidine-containing phosphotransfer) domain-containing protein
VAISQIPPETQVPILDESRLLEEFGRDPQVLAELRDLFLEHLPPLLDEIKEALQAADPEVVARNAHSLKGASNTYGALRLAQVGKALELEARKGSLADAGELVQCLEIELAKVFQQIRKLGQEK